MTSFYVIMYCAIGLGYFLGTGLSETFDTAKRYRVAMSNQEVVVLGIKIFVLCILFWPYLLVTKKENWWNE